MYITRCTILKIKTNLRRVELPVYILLVYYYEIPKIKWTIGSRRESLCRS
jgi:hypothetical protein